MQSDWTLEKGMEAYRTELRKYVIWTEGLKRTYGPRFSAFQHLNNSDYAKLEKWTATLTGMEKALGFSEGDDEKILQEVRATIPKELLAA